MRGKKAQIVQNLLTSVAVGATMQRANSSRGTIGSPRERRLLQMKTIKDKQVLVAADFAGVALKNAVVAHLEKNGWTCTDIGVKTVDEENPEMFHRIGLRVGAKIAEGEFERALIFCGTGMGIHIAASKCPHVHAAVVESPHAALPSFSSVLHSSTAAL